MIWIRNYIFIAIALCALVATSWGQTVNWSASSNTLQEGKANIIELHFNSCEIVGELTLPQPNGLTLELRNTSTNQSIINGRRSSQVVYTFVATPSRQGSVAIPFFEVETNIGKLPVQEARFEVVEATVGDTGVSPEDVFFTQFQIRDTSIYEGEVFQIDYYAGAKQEFQLAELSKPDWNPSNFVVSGLMETQSGGLDWQGERYSAVAYESQAMATESGTVELSQVRQNATVVVGRRRGFMFTEPVYDTFQITSNPFAIEILPLPDNAPASFSGAVGSFELTSRIVPETVQIGEPVTWTLELSGKGNWPSGIGVPTRFVSTSFQAIQPQIKNEIAEDSIFEGKQTEDIVLVPKDEGSFIFGPIDYSYFDPEIGEYKTITIPAASVSVNPIEIDDTSAFVSNVRVDQQKPELNFDPSGENTSKRPSTLPKEPVISLSNLIRPSGAVAIVQPISIAIASPIVLWVLLAILRAFYLDPNRGRRRAYKKLKSFISKHQVIANTKQEQLLWREYAADYWGVSTEEPTPAEIEQAARKAGAETVAEQWRQLWQESDKVLFSGDDIDSSKWKKLFDDTLPVSPKPKRNLSKFASKVSWLGCFAFILVALSFPESANADDAKNAYDKGDFKAASIAWEDKIQSEPDVWEHRYNAGLAAAQQTQWGKAWAYFASAYCLNPHDERIEWNLKFTHTHTTAYDQTLQSLLDRENVFKVIGLRSPGQWEEFSGYAFWAATGALMLAVVFIYLRPVRPLALALLFIGICSILSGLFGKWAHSKYGPLSNPKSILITETVSFLSVPTDLGAEQIEATVGDGTIALIQKKFLGWVKIELPNGDIGWIRENAFLPLYGAVESKSE